MEHKFMRLFVDSKWTGKEDRSINVKEGEVDGTRDSESSK